MSTGTDIGLFDKQAQGVEGLTVAANSWDGVTDATADRYKSAYTYDANGNIETVKRFDETGTQYDDLEYHYEKSGTQLLRNRLYHLNETIDGGYGDIGVDASAFHPAHADVNQLNNYKYDELGNLIADKREEIANIEWTVSGKVKHITRTAGSTKPELWFTYGADGQRISKTVGDPLNGGYREWYLRDAQGNIMAVYKYTNNGTSLKVTERPVYGSSRLGSYTRQMELVGEPTIINYPYTQPMQAPLKRYELTDHLGNVNTVVTGRLLPGNGAGSAKQAEVVSATGYEAFGALLPGRSYSSDNYRFGFNGQEKDNELYGAEGTSLNYTFRMYDPRVSRFFAVDPVTHRYPYWTPYQFAGNMPIKYLDSEGLQPGERAFRAGLYLANPKAHELEMKAVADMRERMANTDPMEALHFTLDGFGMVPVIGEPADAINGGLYLLEGNKTDAALSFGGMVPIAGWFATTAKWSKKAVTLSRKYGDDVSGLVQTTVTKGDEGAREIFTITKSGSFKDAKAVMKDALGDLGDDAVDYVSTTGKGTNPFYGKTVGKSSADGKRYWRVDWDAESGAHVNWVNGKEKGSIPFTGGFDQARRIVENEVVK